jgi:uncharacterized C2H2 Zn-finger protein
LCDYSAYRRTDIDTHSKAVHIGNNKDFKCDHCDKAFTRENTLVRHVNKKHKNLNIQVNVIEETNEIDIKEELIGDVTAAEDAILKIQKFRCDHCDKAFSENSKLQRHINATHKKIKRFACDLCDYSSYYKTNLNKHSKAVHLGKNKKPEPREFKCDHCDKAYTQKWILVQHVNTVHKKPDFGRS